MLDRFGRKMLGVGTAVAVAAVFTIFSAPATADAQVSFGVQGSYGTEIEAVGAGARVNYGLQGSNFGLSGSFDFFFPDNFDWWEINANGTYSFATEGGSLAPYAGAGLNYANVSVSGSAGGTTFSASDSEVGLNLLGGFQFGGDGGITPYVEGRYATTGAGQFYLTGGILF